MTLAELENADKRMRQKWYDLVMTEQRGASVQVLERMYNSYVLAMEEYNRCSEEYLREQQAEHSPIPVKQKKSRRSSSKDASHKKLAS